MVGEVVTGERVDEVAVAGDVGCGDRDDLAVSGRRRHGRGVVEQVGRIRREQGGGDQGGHVVAGAGLFQDGATAAASPTASWWRTLSESVGTRAASSGALTQP